MGKTIQQIIAERLQLEKDIWQLLSKFCKENPKVIPHLEISHVDFEGRTVIANVSVKLEF